MRKVDIAHSGQTVPEAIELLRSAVKSARQAGEDALLVIHGYGKSGVGGAIRAELESELPRLRRLFGIKVLRDSDRDRLPEWLHIRKQDLNSGSTLLVFRQVKRDKESDAEFRPNFREFRKRVKVGGSAPRPSPRGERTRGGC